MKEIAIKPALFALAALAVLVVCVAVRATAREPVPDATVLRAPPHAAVAPLVVPTDTNQPATTSAREPGPTQTPELAPTAAPTPTRPRAPVPPPSPTPSPTVVSEVAAAVQVPADAAVDLAPSGGTRLTVPQGTRVVWGGCASDGTCYPYNFYWAPTQEVVMQDGESQDKVQHELCHAHQHWAINGGAPLDPSDYDLESWYGTAEGRSFMAMAEGLSWPWSQSAVNGLEDFAWVCAYWYIDPGHLLRASPERYRWAQQHLP